MARASTSRPSAPSDVADEREQLERGDRIHSIDGACVAAPPTSAPPSDGQSSSHNLSLEEAKSTGLSLEEAKRLVRASGASVTVEVWREEVRPMSERLLETKAHLEGELKSALDIASPGLADRLDEGTRAVHERLGALTSELSSTVEEWGSELSGRRSSSSSTNPRVMPPPPLESRGAPHPAAGGVHDEAGGAQQPQQQQRQQQRTSPSSSGTVAAAEAPSGAAPTEQLLVVLD